MRSQVFALAIAAIFGCKQKPEPAPTPPAASSAPVIITSATTTTVMPTPTLSDATAPGVLVASNVDPTAYCAVFGAFPLESRANADALRAKLAPSTPSVEVRDASDFNELAWGQLVVVSSAPDRATAQARVNGAMAVQQGYVKECSPLADSLATPPEAADGDSSSQGCIGWNTKSRRAVCVTGRSEIQGGRDFAVHELNGGATLAWLPRIAGQMPAADQRTPATAVVTALKVLLKKGKYTSLAKHRFRVLTFGGEAAWVSPKLTVRYERRRLGLTSQEMTDTIEIECKGNKRTLLSHTVKGPADAEKVALDAAAHRFTTDGTGARLHYAPVEHLLLIDWRAVWASEGNIGNSAEAALIDMDKEECAN